MPTAPRGSKSSVTARVGTSEVEQEMIMDLVGRSLAVTNQLLQRKPLSVLRED